MVVEGEYYDGPCKLLEIPQDVMRILFTYLDSTSLFQLSQTCNFLKEFVLDPSFWRCIEAREEPNTGRKIYYCSERIHQRTTKVLFRGTLSFANLPPDFFTHMKHYRNLRILALENLKLRGHKITLRDFPHGLEELSLRRTHVIRSDHFFQHSVTNMPKLRVLILDECSWVTCSFLLSVSKYEHLEIISIVRCLKVHLHMIPYLNVAKLGCKKLKIFDCRFTGIGGELLRTFYNKDIQRLYFQSFKSTEVDYGENIFNYMDIRKLKNQPIPDPSDPSCTDMSIVDNHLCEYRTAVAKPRDQIDKIGNSYLYKDPYPECRCEGVALQEDKIDTKVQFPDEDLVHIPSGRGEPKFVCNKHMKDIVNLPKNFKDFFLSQQQQFNPDMNMDSDSNSDEEEEDGGCCYFGMGTSLIVPSTHDRTPSVGEEMSLPEEGASARNPHFPRVYVFNRDRDNNGARRREGDDNHRESNSPTTSRSLFERRSSLETLPTSSSSSSKRRHLNSEGDGSDTGQGPSKKSRRSAPAVSPPSSSAAEELSSDAHEILVNQLVESVDDVSARIQKIMEANGLTASDLERRKLRLSVDKPSTSRNGTDSLASGSRINHDQPACSKSPDLDEIDIDMPSSSNMNGSNNSNSDTNRESDSDDDSNSEAAGRLQEELPNNPINHRNMRAALVRFEVWQPRGKNNKAGNEIPLKRLSLRGYKKITDFTLDQIRNLDIELIDLTYTSVSRRGIENFLINNPNCRVIHPLYCVCKPSYPFF